MKKIVVLLAVTLMVVFALAGCGSSQNDTQATNDAAQTESQQAKDQSTQESKEQAAKDANEQAGQASDQAKDQATTDIGVEKATEIAIKDAGLNESDVQFTKQQADVDDGVSIYEIEFVSGDTEYEYDIDAATGKILEQNTDSVYDD